MGGSLLLRTRSESDLVLVLWQSEAGPALRARGRRDQLPQRVEDGCELLVVFAEPLPALTLELGEASLDRVIRQRGAAQFHERSHDRDVDHDGGSASEDAGQHRDALLCEDVRRVAAATPSL
jgi:hypothetical protein